MKRYKINLHKKQLEISSNILKSKSKYHIINASRQSGKSYMALMLLLKYAIEESNLEIMFVSPVHKQNKKVFNKLKQLIKYIGYLDTADGTDLDLYTTNGNHIQFRSAERYDNIRGESIDLLIVDEFSFIKKDAWESAIRPVTAARKNAKVILISTPKGHNLFYDMALLGMSDDNDRYCYYKMMYYDNPYYDLSEVEDAKLTLPENIFKTEYLAEFIADGLVFSRLNRLCVLDSAYPWNDTPTFAGLDFGKTVDYTVLTILDNNGNCVFFNRWHRQEWSTIENEIVDVLNKFNPILYAEANTGTINDPLFESLSKRYTNIYPFQTTNSSKEELVGLMNLSIEEDIIKLPSKNWNRQVFFEFNVFEYTYSVKTRKVVYSAPSGMNDDIVISACLANKSYRENRYGVTSEWITDENKNW